MWKKIFAQKSQQGDGGEFQQIIGQEAAQYHGARTNRCQTIAAQAAPFALHHRLHSQPPETASHKLECNHRAKHVDHGFRFAACEYSRINKQKNDRE
jgi:hypothetical protein